MTKDKGQTTKDENDTNNFSSAMIYFDNNATTQIAPEVRDAMAAFLDDSFGNPSSAHRLGTAARDAIERSREAVAKLLGAAKSSEIVFTSGGTESDNWAIRGALLSDPAKQHIVTTRVEHEAVRKVCEMHGDVTWVDVDENGSLDIDGLRRSIRPDTAIVSIMLANNETGVVFPVAQAAEIVKERSDALVHVDGVNAAGKIGIDLNKTNIDLFSISAHKFHGPKGVGALYVRDGVRLPSFSLGGGQEHGRRAGTEAVHQICGMGAAADLAGDLSPMERVRTLRDKLESEILRRILNASVNGTIDPQHRLPNTSNISFENINGEMILARLDDAGIYVSTGSACNAPGHVASPVLQAMNVPFSKAMGSIRFSLGRYNTEEEVDRVVEELERIIPELAELGGVRI